MAYARQIFDQITYPNVFLWNAMFKGYAESEFYIDTLIQFDRMKKRDVKPNAFTFPFVLKSCGKMSALREGKEVHCFAIKSGLEGNVFVSTTLIDMYSGGREMASAYRVFEEMPIRNVVTWTAIVAAYVLCGDVGSARWHFDQTPDRDVVLWNTMVSGYVESGDMAAARLLFEEMPVKDVMAWNTVLIGYANDANLEACERWFEEMPEKNIFSWNGLIGGYARHGRFFEILSAFNLMLAKSSVTPNDSTIVTVLSACARLGALDVGKWIHVYAENNGFRENIYIRNGLIDMYAKCGSIDIALKVFYNMNSKDLITWNTIINGLAIHGRGSDALNIFDQMKIDGQKPDGITFVGVLCACTHMGLVEDGFRYFQSMAKDHKLIPGIEHYGCMVDLLSRAGLLKEALDFVKKMPMEADGVIWSTVLGACRVHRDVGLGEFAVGRLIGIEPNNVANYVVLSNIYVSVGRWEDVAKLKLVMREMGVKKLPGCSLIEVNDGVTEFHSSDKGHSQTEEIYGVLKGLTELIKSAGYEPELDEFCEGI